MYLSSYIDRKIPKSECIGSVVMWQRQTEPAGPPSREPLCWNYTLGKATSNIKLLAWPGRPIIKTENLRISELGWNREEDKSVCSLGLNTGPLPPLTHYPSQQTPQS